MASNQVEMSISHRFCRGDYFGGDQIDPKLDSDTAMFWMSIGSKEIGSIRPPHVYFAKKPERFYGVT